MKRCKLCNADRLFAFCNGCRTPVCKDCCRMEMTGSGCVCAWPVYYCLTCISSRPAPPVPLQSNNS
jgi:hypothetical protein